MTKSELQKLAKEKPNVITRILKSNHIDLYTQINSKYTTIIKFTEKLYLYVNDMGSVICKSTNCNNNCKFISLNKGYSIYCSNQCAADDLGNIRSESIKKTLRERYGVSSPSQIAEVKTKLSEYHKSGIYDYVEINKKTKKTLLDKYGDSTYNNLDKSKITKLENYGDENYNNRIKYKETLIVKYGEPVHPNVKKSTTLRSNNGEIGFKSEKFKNWLKSNNIENVSQLEECKIKKLKNKIDSSYINVMNRIEPYVIPNFTPSQFEGVGYYTVLYNFNCKTCNENFDDYLYGGHIPRCPKCFPKYDTTSMGQYELYHFLKEILPNDEVILNDRNVLNGKELDIYIPNKKIAIEFNGVYYHSEISGGKNKKYHLNKTNNCHSKSIRLIHIKDTEWYNSKDVIKNRLFHILTNSTERIYARKCKVVELTNTQKTSILTSTHLQGNDKSQIYLGLIYNDEIISIMTFGNLRNIMGSISKQSNYELYRYSSSKNVIGGASKLISYFIRNYSPEKIITYAKVDWGYSNFYEKIGFKFVNQTPPNYWYINKGKLTHRSNFQKHKLKNKLEIFDENLSEWQNMQLNGYDRIWDCGNLKYEWNFK